MMGVVMGWASVTEFGFPIQRTTVKGHVVDVWNYGGKWLWTVHTYNPSKAGPGKVEMVASGEAKTEEWAKTSSFVALFKACKAKEIK